MILNTLYCENNNRCYFLAFNVIQDMTEECELHLSSVELEDGTKTNIITNKYTGEIVFKSDNPLKIYDFLKGYIKAIESNTL